MQLYFKEAGLVSMSDQSKKDKLEIFFNKNELAKVVDDKHGLSLDWSDHGGQPRVERDIMAQLGIGTSAERVVAAADSAKAAMNFVVILNFLLTFVFTMSLNLLWGMINNLQMIVFLPLLDHFWRLVTQLATN